MAKRATLTVASVFTDLAGTVMTNDKDIATAYIERAKSLLENDDVLEDMTDEQVVAIVKAIPGKGDDVEDKRTLAVYEFEAAGSKDAPLEDESYTPTPIADRIAIRRESAEAYGIGVKMDTATVDHLQALAKAKEDFDGAPLLISEDIERVFCKKDANGKVVSDPSLGWAQPNTWPKGTDNPKGTKKIVTGNGIPDHYSITPANGGSKIVGTYYGDVFEGTSMGKRNVDIARLGKDLGPSSTLSEPDKLYLRNCVSAVDPAMLDYVDLAMRGDTDARSSLLKWNAGQKTSAVNKIRKAVEFRQQKARIEDLGMHVMVAKGLTIALATKLRDPIQIYYQDAKLAKGVLSPAKVTSLGAFIKYDVAKAKRDAEAVKQAVTPAHLYATTAREKGKNKGQGAVAAPVKMVVATPAQFEDYANASGQYVKDHAVSILKRCSEPGGEMLIEYIGDLHRMLDENVMPAISVQYENLIAKRNEQNEARAAEELQARGLKVPVKTGAVA